MRTPTTVVILGLAVTGCGAVGGAPQGRPGVTSGSVSGNASGERAHAVTPAGPGGTGASAGQALTGRGRRGTRIGPLYTGFRRLRHIDDPWASPLAGELLVAFANEYINWNARTVVADMRLLASQSVGQAHAAMELAAGETARDYELQRGGISNSGVVEGVAPLSGPGRRWVIVTRERTTATNTSAYRGLAPEWHVIVASVVELWPGRWAVNLWQPES